MRRDTDGRQARDTAEAWREGGGQVWAVHYAEEQEEVVPQVWAALAGDDALLSGTASFEQQIGKWVTEKEKRVPTSIWRCARL